MMIECDVIVKTLVKDIVMIVPIMKKTRMWANAQRDGRPALCSTPQFG